MKTNKSMSAFSVDAPREPLAIVGIGCRFPGGAHDPGAFWRVISQGADVFTDVPPERWDMRKFYDPDPSRKGRCVVRQGAFLRQKIDEFDAGFFGISPRDARWLDPAQRLLHEVAWEAFEDAGIVPATLAGSATGVFIGGFFNDMLALGTNDLNRWVTDAGTTNSMSLTLLSERLSYFFDFRGPSVSLDTACSSSLVAFHQACTSVWNNESRMALAGGATVMLIPATTTILNQGGFLSPDARCKPFDASANGYARGEGAGIVVLKRLSDAIADGNPIYSLVLGTSCNQDGRTEGLTVPRAASQVALIREACAKAGVLPGRIQYVEAHGTGTAVGDPVEAAALGEALSEGRPPEDRCLVGSVKSVIGHTEAAAGIAGVIKTALCIHRREVPANLGFTVPNPAIDFEGLRLRVAARHEPWPQREEMALAGINSFGFGGTNAHAILASAPPRSTINASATDASKRAALPFVVPLSGQTESALRALATRWRDFTAPGGAATHEAVADLCRAAGAHRTHFAHRLAIVAASVEELHEQLQAYLSGVSHPGLVARRAQRERPRLCFVYSGMGPQWWAMGRELLESDPLFRSVVTRCSAALEPFTGWSLLELLQADEKDSRVAETQVAQSGNFALQVALTELWASWGVRPDAVLGHSVGEVAAAYVSGALDFDDAIRVTHHRSRCQARAAGLGQMLATGLSEKEVAPVLERWAPRIGLAAVNGPNATTLAGDPEAIAGVAADLAQRGVYNRLLRVDIAYHSPHMDPVREDLLDSLGALTPRVPAGRLFSTVTADAVTGPELGADYWWRNVRDTVRFSDAIRRAGDEGYEVFIEVGPHPVLGSSITDILEAAGRKAEVASSLARGKPERRRMLEALASLYTSGCDVDWTGVSPDGQFLRLPLYPWQREVYWAESGAALAERRGSQGHALFGTRLNSPQPSWEGDLSRAFVPYADDHLVENTPILPAAAYLDAALAADRELGGVGVLQDIRIHSPLVMPRAEATFVRLSMEGANGDFAIHSKEQTDNAAWRLHATGRRLLGSPLAEPQRIDLDLVRRRCVEGAAPGDYYAMLASDRGLTYGAGFRGVSALWVGHDEVLAEIKVPEAVTQDRPESYCIHPAVLDASLHGMFALVPKGRDVYLPSGIEGVRFYGKPGARLFSYIVRSTRGTNSLSCDVTLCDEDGRVLVQMRGLLVKRLDHSESAQKTDALYHHPRWLPAKLQASTRPAAAEPWLVLLHEDQAGIGEALVQAGRSAGVEVLTARVGQTFSEVGPGDFRVRSHDSMDLEKLVEAVRRNHPVIGCVIDCWRTDLALEEGPEAKAGGAELSAVEQHALGQVRLVRALRDAAWAKPPRLWTVFRGSAPVAPQAVNCAQTALSGLTRVLRSEASALRCSAVDLDPKPAAASELIGDLVREFAADTAEDMVAFRGGHRYVLRIEPGVPEALEAQQVVAAGTTPLRLETYATPQGSRPRWRVFQPTAVGPKDVRIEVKAAALASSPSEPSEEGRAPVETMDLCGVVEAVGEEVSGLQPGDSVVAVHRGVPASRVVVPMHCVARSPKAVARPGVAVLLRALDIIAAARLVPGEKILVRGASTALGQSLIALARAAKAQVWAAATSSEALEAVKSLREVQVVDAQHSGWGDSVLQGTQGRGVDVLVDLLPGGGAETEAYGMLLGAGGRLLLAQSAEGTGRSVALRAGQSLWAFDPSTWVEPRPDSTAERLREVVERIAKRELPLPPLKEFSPEGISDAVENVSRTEAAGGAALYFGGMKVAAAPELRPLFRDDASYLVTGGLGGLGLHVARWMAEQGARTLILGGRSGAASDEARQGIAAIERLGARVVPVSLDVSDAKAVEELVARIARELPPLAGILHSAVVLDDCNIDQLTPERLHATFAAKAQGAWNLHRATLNLPLEQFILMSSASSLFGPVGQASYVAANAFLDGLAHHRQHLGLPALAAHWGLMSDVGVGARARKEKGWVKTYGLKEIPLALLTPALSRMLKSRAPEVGFLDLDGDTVELLVPNFGMVPAFQAILTSHPRRVSGDAQPSSPGSLWGELATASVQRRLEVVGATLLALAAEVLGTDPGRLEQEEPLANYGLDSMMAGQLKVLIERATGTTLPAVRLVSGPSVVELTELLLERMAAAAEPAPKKSEVSPRDVDMRATGS